MREFKFIHTSDTEIEACWPPTSIRAHALAVESYWESFRYLIDYAIENRVDFIANSGDFTGSQISKNIKNYKPASESQVDVLGRLMSELERLRTAGIPFIITSGQQEIDLLEYLDKEGLVHYVEMSRGRRDYYDLEPFGQDTKIRVYGLGEAPNQADRIAKLASMMDMEDIGFGILIGHVWLPELGWAVSSEDEDSNSWTPERLISEKGIDFIGLGHNHEHYQDAKRHIYNTGSAEWHNFDEAGAIFYTYDSAGGDLIETGRRIVRKGFSLVSVRDEKFDVEFIPIPTRTVFNLEIVFHDATPEDVLRGVKEAIQINVSMDRNAILRPILSGSVASGFELEEFEKLGDSIKDSVNALYVEGPVVRLEK